MSILLGSQNTSVKTYETGLMIRESQNASLKTYETGLMIRGCQNASLKTYETGLMIRGVIASVFGKGPGEPIARFLTVRLESFYNTKI